MLFFQKKPSRGIAIAIVLIFAAIGGGALTGLAEPTHAASAMSPVDRLIAEDAIRQQIVLYSLLADGDGEQPKNTRALADAILAPGFESEVFLPDGTQKGAPVGREEIRAHVAPADPSNATAGRHFLVSTYFDEVTPATAKTRTTAVQFVITKSVKGADCQKPGAEGCGGQIVRSMTFVYHDTWAKTPKGWMKTHSILRGDE
jgi:hypothetical protein